jgi:hypothetical protein
MVIVDGCDGHPAPKNRDHARLPSRSGADDVRLTTRLSPSPANHRGTGPGVSNRVPRKYWSVKFYAPSAVSPRLPLSPVLAEPSGSISLGLVAGVEIGVAGLQNVGLP